MSHILFIDESCQDLRESSYEVLAGIAIEDRDLWNLICRVQDADIVAYVKAWGVRIGGMSRPAREELNDLAAQVCELRYQTRREVNGNPDFAIWSFAVIDDLRPRDEREEAGGQ